MKAMDGGRRVLRGWSVAIVVMAGWSSTPAVELPPVSVLKQQMKTAPVEVRVVEPHLSVKAGPTQVVYVGYSAQDVLSHIFGKRWQEAKDADIEFRALDGYVSRVSIERLKKYDAYLTFERKDQATFSVDNQEQNEKNIPLGPYYLVWDSVKHPGLVHEGGTYWPYQVTQVLISTERKKALLPVGMKNGYKNHADLTQKYCLSCHQVNEFGGEKMPINLASIVKGMDKNKFMEWVLNPTSVKSDTNMPALPKNMSDVERSRVAYQIYEYLKNVPLKN